MRSLHYVWVGHLPRRMTKDDLWSICIKYGCVKDVLLLKQFHAAIVCYEDKRDGNAAGDKITSELRQKYGKWCSVTVSARGSCFVVEVSPITLEKVKPYDYQSLQNMKHNLYEIFRPCGLIMAINIHQLTGKPGKASISFGQLSAGLQAATLQPELFGEVLTVTLAPSTELFRHKIPRAMLPQAVAADDLVTMLETLVQVEYYDEVSDIFYLFGSKVEINWALEHVNCPEELDTSSSSTSLAKGLTCPTELVELSVSRIPKAAGIEEVEHLLSRFGLVAQVIKDETVQNTMYKCYIRMLVSSSREFSARVIPKIDGNVALRGSTLQVSELMAPKLPSTDATSSQKKEPLLLKNCEALEETKIKLLPESEGKFFPEMEYVSEEVDKKLPSDNTKLSIDAQKELARKGSLEEFDSLLKLTNLHHENIYQVEYNGYSFKTLKKEKISKGDGENFVKLFVFGNDYSNKEMITEALKNLAEVADLWIPSSGYSYVVVKLFSKESLSIILSVTNESVGFRLALSQSMDKSTYYDHPILEHGWMCSQARCDTYNVGMSCSKCGLECRSGNCRAALQQVHGVVTKIFDKSRGIVAFMEPKTGREDYAFFYRGKLDLASSPQEFENIVGKYIIFNTTSTGGNWEELVEDIWVCWIVTKATLAPYNYEDGVVSKERLLEFNTQNEDIQKLEQTSLQSSSNSRILHLWPTIVESVTTFWAKDLDEGELLTRLLEVNDACLMREVLDEVPEIDGIYGALLASDGRFHRVKVTGVHHIHCIEVFYVDKGCSSTLSITTMRYLPLHLTSLPVAARRYSLAGCYPVTQDQSLVYGHYYKGKEWLKTLLIGEEVTATGMMDGGKFLVDCIAADLHVNTEVLDRGFTTQVLELPPNFQEIVPK